jgi:hypothetical protein
MSTPRQGIDLALARVRELGFGVRPDKYGDPFDEEDARYRPFRDAEHQAIDLVRRAPASLEPFLVRRLRESCALARRTAGEETVCRVLVTGLGDRWSTLAAPILCRIFADRFGSEFLRDEILAAIHPGYGRRRILFTLRLALRDTDECTRGRAIRCLEHLCGQAALPEVTGFILDPSTHVRSALVDVLGKLRTPMLLASEWMRPGKSWVARTACGLTAALAVVAAGSGVSAAPRAANDVATPAACLDDVVTGEQLKAMTARLEELNETLLMLLATLEASDHPDDALLELIQAKMVELEATQRAAMALVNRYMKVFGGAVPVGCHPERSPRVS